MDCEEDTSDDDFQGEMNVEIILMKRKLTKMKINKMGKLRMSTIRKNRMSLKKKSTQSPIAGII